MTTYNISTEAYETSYQADTAEGAILAYVQDMGYDTIEQAADVLDITAEQFCDNLIVTEAR